MSKTMRRNAYELMSDEELERAIATLERQVDDIRAERLSLDMARGKPSPAQTALSRPMLDLVNSTASLSDGDEIGRAHV